MAKIDIESDIKVDGLECVVVGTSMGHRCGYVIIRDKEKYGKLTKEQLKDLDCHGGVTYCDNDNHPIPNPDNDIVVGFDCGHFEDSPDLNIIMRLASRTERYVASRVANACLGGHVWTKEEVEEELRSMCDQIKALVGEEDGHKGD